MPQRTASWCNATLASAMQVVRCARPATASSQTTTAANESGAPCTGRSPARDGNLVAALLIMARPAAAGSVLGLDDQHREELPRAGAVTAIFSGSAVFLVVLGFSLFGDGLRDALDPRGD